MAKKFTHTRVAPKGLGGPKVPLRVEAQKLVPTFETPMSGMRGAKPKTRTVKSGNINY